MESSSHQSSFYCPEAMLTCVAPFCDVIWICRFWPLPSETLSREVALPLPTGEVARTIRSAQPSAVVFNEALKLRPAINCSMACAAEASGPHRWKDP